MKTRKLGKLEVSEMGFGCMSISANDGPAADRNQGIEVIRAREELPATRVRRSGWSKIFSCFHKRNLY